MPDRISNHIVPCLVGSCAFALGLVASLALVAAVLVALRFAFLPTPARSLLVLISAGAVQ